LNPGSLNLFMQVTDTDFIGSNVWWSPTTRDASGGNLQVCNIRSSSTHVLDAGLSAGFPVIVRVPSSPSHFVLVTGKLQSDGDYLIADPFLPRGFVLLSDYGSFETRGWVKDPTGDISELDAALGTNADILIRDPLGRTTGLDPATAQETEQIPESSHFIDAITDDLTGEPPDDFLHSVTIRKPMGGTYDILVIGKQLGTYTLSLRAFSQDGTSQPSIEIPGISSPGSSSHFSFQYVSTPGAKSSGVQVATFSSTLADISNSLALGLIDDAGIANSLTRKIQAAASAAAEGEREDKGSNDR